MKILKPHFWYNKSQRNGVFFLLLIIISLQLLSSFFNFEEKEAYFSDNESIEFQKQIDSLKKIKEKKTKFRIFLFNPNYLTDYRASQLGMSVDEIDRLFRFRKQNKFINSSSDFQRVTKISDSLLLVMAPYFKFPEWVSKQKEKIQFKKRDDFVKKSLTTDDLNLATKQDFESIKGVSANLAKRIIKYRTKIKGFSFRSQLYEVWGLDKITSDKISLSFSIPKKPFINKLNVNTASFKEVLSNPYIDYQLCKKIFEFRDEVAELQSIEELKQIQGFPLDKYDRIVLYLEAK